MKKCVVFAAVAALASQLAAPAFAAEMFDRSTMLGWQRTASPTAMAYVRMPFQSAGTGSQQPRAGFMITPPHTYRPGTAQAFSSAHGVVDFGITGRDFHQPWTTSLNLNNAVAWTGNAEAMPKNATYLFESGVSWVVVGVASVVIIAGTIALSNEN